MRETYDLLMKNKGEPVTMVLSPVPSGAYDTVTPLRDYYGLDIRRIRNGRWILAGEWFGKTYVDYVADRFNKLSKEKDDFAA